MTRRSGLAQAGTVLLLVGAIIQTVVTGLLVTNILAFLYTATAMFGDPGARPERVMVIFIVLAVVAATGAVVAWIAWRRARHDDTARKGAVTGIVAALLPPFQLVTLVGAVLLLVSEEAQPPSR